MCGLPLGMASGTSWAPTCSSPAFGGLRHSQTNPPWDYPAPGWPGCFLSPQLHWPCYREDWVLWEGLFGSLVVAVIQNPESNLSNSSVVLESGIPLFLTIHTRKLDKLMHSELSSAFKQLRHAYAVHWHAYSFLSKNSLMYANVPLCIHGCR